MSNPRTPAHVAASLVVVADRARARFFTTLTPNGPLVEGDDLVNPEARLHEGDLTSDRSGHINSAQHGGHSTRGATSARQLSADRFARQVCERLSTARRRGDVSRVHLVAERTFLGLLRQHLDDALRTSVVTQIGKSVARRDVGEIRALLPRQL